MNSLVLAGERLRIFHPSMALLLDDGKLNDVVMLGRSLLERSPRVSSIERRDEVLVGQTMIRSLLVLGREEEAESLMGSMFQVYQSLPRQLIRCYTAMDYAELMLHLNKPARATQFAAEIADDENTEMDSRIEALLILAEASMRLGRQETAFQCLDVAQRWAASTPSTSLRMHVDSARIRLEVFIRCRCVDGLSDHDQYNIDRESTIHPRSNIQIQQELDRIMAFYGVDSLMWHQTMQLRCMLNGSAGCTKAIRSMCEELDWIHKRSLLGIENNFRLNAGMACLGAQNFAQAQEFLKPMIFDERQLSRHRYAVELTYCMAKLHTQQGRHLDALRFYKMYAASTLTGIRGDHTQIREARCTAAMKTQPHVDAIESRLPVRYRRAYRHLLEHLDRPELSVRQVAAHIGVTERALQLTFSKHLCMTPAEVISKIRMERIHADLMKNASETSVLEVAARWGVVNRSTLAHRYRQMFSETPSDTRRNGLARAVG